MLHLDDTPACSSTGTKGIPCPFCKQWVFNPKGIVIEDKPGLQWKCIHCEAGFTSNGSFEEPGEDKKSYKEKIIAKLLEEGNCENIVKIFATSSKKPPIFIEQALRELLNDI